MTTNVRVAVLKDLRKILEIEKDFRSDLFFASDKSDVRRSIESGCSLVICDDNKKIRAFILVYFTEYATSYLEKVFVHPDFRGNGLQQYLIAKSTILLHRMGVRICYTMVNPSNKISVDNFLKYGFVHKWHARYKNEQRIILAHEIGS